MHWWWECWMCWSLAGGHMLWLAHLVWRLECSREGLLAGLGKPGDSYLYVTMQKARSFTERV